MSKNSEDLFKLKRKWQITLRRYVLEQKPCPSYAKYFGLPIYLIREWIESQFINQMSWDNFGKQWQFDHVIPFSYFDFDSEEDLSLCWNFINIRVGDIQGDNVSQYSVNLLAAKVYFENVYSKTGYYLIKKMIQKIESIEQSQIRDKDVLENFILKHDTTLLNLEKFSETDFERVNWGMTVADVVAENQLINKYGK